MLVELDDEVVAAAQKLADQQGAPVGRVISELARKVLVAETDVPIYRNGARLFRREKCLVQPDLELVNRFRDEE